MNKHPGKLLQVNIALLLVTTLSLTACNESRQTTTTTQAEEVKVMIPEQACYIGVIGKDTIFLKAERFPNVVTGKLAYRFYEKDKSQGELEGKMYGDTLVADYTFSSEGQTSIRQVAFLLQGADAREGYGELEEKEGKMVFKNRGQLRFTGSVLLKKVACADQ